MNKSHSKSSLFEVKVIFLKRFITKETSRGHFHLFPYSIGLTINKTYATHTQAAAKTPSEWSSGRAATYKTIPEVKKQIK